MRKSHNKGASFDPFSELHPLVQFTFFLIVIGFSMLCMHPVAQAASFICGAAYLVILKGFRGLKFLLRVSLPMVLLAAIINPAFSHEGVTILAYLPTGNPLTLESILYGLSAGFMLASVLVWFNCYFEVMSSDKFVYLVGRAIPSLALLLSMTLRFVPRFKRQLELVKEAREVNLKAQAAKSVKIAEMNPRKDLLQGLKNVEVKEKDPGEQGTLKNPFKRLRFTLSCFSAVVTWSLENSIETADSMKSRGYGLKGRTSFSIYTFSLRDRLCLALTLCAGIFLLTGYVGALFVFRYYPMVRTGFYGAFTIIGFFLLILFEGMPVIMSVAGRRAGDSRTRD